MITPSCTITCRLRKSLLATLPLTGRLLGRLLTGCPVTTTNTPPPPACPPPRLSLTPLPWGGRLSGSAHRYSTPFCRLLESLSHASPAGPGGNRVSTSSPSVSPIRGRAQSSPQLEYDLQMHSASSHPGTGYKRRRALTTLRTSPTSSGGCPGDSEVKNLPAMQETWFQSLGREDPLGEGNGNPLQVFLPGESHGQRSLAGCSPWGRKESGTTYRLSSNCKPLVALSFACSSPLSIQSSPGNFVSYGD